MQVNCEGYERDGRSRDAPTGAKQGLGREGSFGRFRDTEVFVDTGFFLREVKEHFAVIFEPVLYLFYKFTSILASSAIKVR